MTTKSKPQSENPNERLRAHQALLQEYQTRRDGNQIELSIIALKSLLILNGGAAVAMLGFVASVSSASESSIAFEFDAIVASMQLYCYGAALSVFTTMLVYVMTLLQGRMATMYELNKATGGLQPTKKYSRLNIGNNLLHIFALCSGTGSLVSFLVATYHITNIVSSA